MRNRQRAAAFVVEKALEKELEMETQLVLEGQDRGLGFDFSDALRTQPPGRTTHLEIKSKNPHCV
eukprot:3565631-Rhodomonas_salina.3